MATSRRYTIDAVDRALLVLEALAEHPDTGVTELSKRLGFTKTLTFRLLQTLEERGFVAKEGGQAHYALGYRLAYLGSCVDPRQSVVVAAAPIIDQLRDETDENVNLIVRDATYCLFVATRESRQSMRLFARAGRRGPLHAGGGSMLLLAYAPEEIVDEVLAGPLKRYTPFTLTEPQALREKLKSIRDRGFNLAQDDLDVGAYSIAVPIWGPQGDVVAALSVAGPNARLDTAREESHLSAAKKAAELISARLGQPATEGDQASLNEISVENADAA
ncbi:MAG: IclR family transcriptional regulator [Pseudomonadota bacterium]